MIQIVGYHSSNDPQLVAKRMLHVGTLAQARMRGGAHLHRVTLQPGMRIPRVRDHGSWNARTLMRHAPRARILVYLNRHEGIPIEEFDAARQRRDIDRMADSHFRKAIASAADSWIVLDQNAIVSIERIDWP